VRFLTRQRTSTTKGQAVRKLMIAGMSALAFMGYVWPAGASAPALQHVLGIAGGTWRDTNCGMDDTSEHEVGLYATATQPRQGRYELSHEGAFGPMVARSTRNDGRVLSGSFSERGCSGTQCRIVAVRLGANGDIAEARIGILAVTGTSSNCGTDPGVTCGTVSYMISGTVIPARQIGYAMLDANGGVHTFGGLTNYGNARTTNAIGFAQTPTHQGYWIADAAGHVFSFGDARWRGNADRTKLTTGETITAISATPTGRGYWLFTTKSRVIPFGDAHSYGDAHATRLNQPVIAAVATPTGHGYYLVAKDGGIFAFGDAHFYGSTGNTRLNKPIIGLVPTPTNTGYWLVAADGGVFGFHAPFRGSLASHHLNRPIVTLQPYGSSYLVISADGGTFNFSGNPTFGNLAGTKLTAPIVSATAAG
jgi:hypothetical protein